LETPVTGSAHPLIILADALENARSGDKIVVVNFGSGSDAMLFGVTDEAERLKSKNKLIKNLNYRTELVIYEDLQILPRGKAKDDIDAGFYDLNVQVPCQTDGGLKSFGHPIGASGIRMVYEVYKQFQGKCGGRQIKNPRLGLTQNLGGFPANCVIGITIWGNEI
jgi:hypothetical protein